MKMMRAAVFGVVGLARTPPMASDPLMRTVPAPVERL
jgi:hypothetical protein